MKSKTVWCFEIQPPLQLNYSSHEEAGKREGVQENKRKRCDYPSSPHTDIKFPFPKYPVKCISPFLGLLCFCVCMCVNALCACEHVCCCCLVWWGLSVIENRCLVFCSRLAGRSNGENRNQDKENIKEIYFDTMKWVQEAISTRHIPVVQNGGPSPLLSLMVCIV